MGQLGILGPTIKGRNDECVLVYAWEMYVLQHNGNYSHGNYSVQTVITYQSKVRCILNHFCLPPESQLKSI